MRNKKSTIIVLFILVIILSPSCKIKETDASDKPNVLWVSVEDITTMLGCYGDVNAHTPNLDAFAKNSTLFSNAFATAPVCSPARSCIVTGEYATSLGSQHLRSEVKIPKSVELFPKFLRKQGYYTSNNSKEDYNFIDNEIWDESSNKAHWKNRNDGQPFFSIFNFTLTHQSAIFGDDDEYKARVGEFLPFVKEVDPATLVLPSYYPDSPEIRKMWARYYTNVAVVDYQFGQVIKELEAAGLSDHTIVIFFSDHGTGMPRSKRALYDSGLKIPLLVHVPPKLAAQYNCKPGTVDERMVSFIDFAPTMLELAGADIPSKWLGKPFISTKEIDRSSYVFGTSDRVDESFEMSRTIRNKKYRYIRNFLPHLPLLQPNFYTDQSRTMQELENFRNSANLSAAQQTIFAKERMAEELYDVENDKDETVNLAMDPAFCKIIQEMRGQLKKEMEKTHDTGLFPEPEMIKLAANSTPYEIAHNPQLLPVGQILKVCDLMLEKELKEDKILAGLTNPNGLVRYWSLITLQVKELASENIRAELNKMLSDNFATVQIEAAKTLLKLDEQEALSTIVKHLVSDDEATALYAARAFQQVFKHIPSTPKAVSAKYNQLENESNDKDFKSKYYKLYTYWALKETFKK